MAYDITAQETIEATIPASALTTSATDVVASPTFTIDVGVSETTFQPAWARKTNTLIGGGLNV